MLITKNKKAFFDYEILKTWEAWIELKWYEVKSIRVWQVNLKWSYISLIWWFIKAKNIHISIWKALQNKSSIDPWRDRNIFLHKKTILYLKSKQKEKWLSIIPLELYFKWSLIKLNVGLCKWRKKFDKKNLLKERSLKKEADILASKLLK